MKRDTIDFESGPAPLRARVRRWVHMGGIASALLFLASGALAQTAPTSSGCDAVNAGAWNVSFTNSHHVLQALQFAPGERLSVTLTGASSTDRLNLALQTDTPDSRTVLLLSSGYGPFPTTSFFGHYTVTGTRDLSFLVNYWIYDDPSATTAELQVTCTSPPDMCSAQAVASSTSGPAQHALYAYQPLVGEPVCAVTQAESKG